MPLRTRAARAMSPILFGLRVTRCRVRQRCLSSAAAARSPRARMRQELHVAAEHLLVLAEPQVVAVRAVAGGSVGLDQRPIQDHLRHAPLLAARQDVAQIGSLVGEDVDALVQVAVASGLGDPGIAGQAVHAPTAHGTSGARAPPAGTGPAPCYGVGFPDDAGERRADGRGTPRRGSGHRAWQPR